MIFHRVLPDFLVQTGLMRTHQPDADGKQLDRYLRKSSAVMSSSSAGDALGWDRKGLEINPRIRFNHRGQVAAAFPIKDSTATDDESLSLRYQFFITLDESPFLDGQHVVFGTVAGPTIFNALRIGKTEVDETTGTPVDMVDSPPRIKGVKIDFHPFTDLVVSSELLIPWKAVDDRESKSGKGQTEMEKRRKKRKGKRDFNVLSFGDEERDYEAMVERDEGRKDGGAIRSSHDVLHSESEFLSLSVDADLKKKVEEKSEEQVVLEKRSKDSSKKKKKIIDDAPGTLEASLMQREQAVDEVVTSTAGTTMFDETNIQSSESDPNMQQEQRKPKKSKSIGAVEARRSKYLKAGHSLANKKERLKREDDTMAKLMAFRNKVLETKGSNSESTPHNNPHKQEVADDSLASRMAKREKEAKDKEARINKEKQDMISTPGYHGQIDEGNSDNDAADTNDWLGTKFKCKRHVDHDSRMTAMDKAAEGGDGRRMDDYLVVDEKKRGDKGLYHHGKRHGGRKSDHRKQDYRDHRR
jgi:cyclophilin family peptidyl-prolyl cis-trans isomerase